jgi:type IV secretory pathway VirJ component
MKVSALSPDLASGGILKEMPLTGAVHGSLAEGLNAAGPGADLLATVRCPNNSQHLETLLAGTIDFVRQVPGGAVVQLEHVGHGFSVPARWGAAFDRAVDGLLEPKSVAEMPPTPRTQLGDLDLPLEVLWPESPKAVVIFVSGDGGWAELDASVARGLSQREIAVVGWNALRYFWSEKKPERLASDLARVRAAIPRDLPVFAGGYSFGAEVVPVVAPRILPDLAGLVLVAPGRWATFEVSPLDWLMSSTAPTEHPVHDAIAAVAPKPVLCLVPSEDGDTGCPKSEAEGYERGELPGGHHFGGAYEELAGRIASFVEKTLSR